ncbi:MAG: DEAD/DEAH box helicase [Candidatus Methanomethylophilaceae archaeon]|nr:DEAD/DEAH box helicase [Candidatus Methanomethylophilaceae archaeon]
MRFEELDIPAEIVSALGEKGYTEMHPPQALALPKALEGRNIVAAVPTAGGKSLIGYIAAMRKVLEEGRKVLYIVPLKALASEKKEDLDGFSHLGFSVAMSTGDLDSDDRGLRDADMIVATSEKADSMIRHGSRWMDGVGLVIADEIHMIHDPSRGPTLEVALTKMMRRNPDLQIIALSATVSNAEDLADWLDADLIRSDWRPVPLREGVYYNWEITFGSGGSIDVPKQKDEIWALISDTVRSGGQCLVFVNARRSTESLAVRYSEDMGRMVGRQLSEADAAVLEGDAESTATGRKLAACVRNGMAFHNAGLTFRQRRYVEEGFKDGCIKCIVATPTLAAGINLPARRVIVRDTRRFEANAGSTPISVMEVKQMCGRAGRPGYDPYGEAVLMAKSYGDYEHLMDDYIHQDTERLTSKLGNENVLRSHILGLLATGDARCEEEVVDFMRGTFFGCVSQLYGIESVVENVIGFLEREGMAVRDGCSVHATPFGKRVSDLYIDPKSAVILRDAVNALEDGTDDFLILQAVASTPDVMGLYPRKSDETRLMHLAEEYDGRFLAGAPDEDDYLYEYFLQDLKTATLLMDWMDEVDEDSITEEMGIGPGDIRSRVDMADWLLYSMVEIAYIFRPETVRRLKPLTTRIRYGVRAELMDLVSLRGVGRARARTLYDAGFRDRDCLSRADTAAVAGLPRIGAALARSMKEQTGSSPGEGGPPPHAPEETRAPSSQEGCRQSRLFDF